MQLTHGSECWLIPHRPAVRYVSRTRWPTTTTSRPSCWLPRAESGTERPRMLRMSARTVVRLSLYAAAYRWTCGGRTLCLPRHPRVVHTSTLACTPTAIVTDVHRCADGMVRTCVLQCGGTEWTSLQPCPRPGLCRDATSYAPIVVCFLHLQLAGPEELARPDTSMQPKRFHSSTCGHSAGDVQKPSTHIHAAHM